MLVELGTAAVMAFWCCRSGYPVAWAHTETGRKEMPANEHNSASGHTSTARSDGRDAVTCHREHHTRWDQDVEQTVIRALTSVMLITVGMVAIMASWLLLVWLAGGIGEH